MNDILAFMRRKVFGVPAGVFVLIGAAVILFIAYRMRNTASDTTSTDTTVDGTASGDAGLIDTTQQPDFSALPDTPSATPVVVTTATNDTNDLWARRAIEWLLTQGYSVEIATGAIQGYLNGNSLSTKEAEARDKAIHNFGLPPESTPDTPVHRVSPAPAGKQGEPPLNHKVKGANDNTPAELAVLYYGTNSGDAVNKIVSANNNSVVPYATGTEIHIPANYVPKYYHSTGHTNTVYEIARKNGTTADKIESLNPGMKFPVKPGTRVRVH